VYSTKLNSTRE